MTDAELGSGQDIAADDAVPDRLPASLREHGQCLQGVTDLVVPRSPSFDHIRLRITSSTTNLRVVVL